MISKKRSNLLSVLVCLTLLSISAQLCLFIIHYHATELMDDFIGSSIPANIFHWAVLLPIAEFVFIQVSAYFVFVSFIWFITVSCSELFRLSAYGLGIFLWFAASLAILGLNYHYFPASLFSQLISKLPYLDVLLWLALFILAAASIAAYYYLFQQKRRLLWGGAFLSLTSLVFIAGGANHFMAQPIYRSVGTPAKPNIILIGLDSLRPDYTGYFGREPTHTPHIDQFLKTAVTFSDAYTPLARTFPAWVSILTGKHPKNSHARINLNYAQPVLANDTVAKQLQAANYETIYATDEKRFSNITSEYGFDRIIGPRMGLNDFMLGSLSDFPLTNLMINLPIGHFLFPYNYANRAAAITYEPDRFLQLVKIALRQRQDKPLFLALHFCVTHWPFTWAADQQLDNLMMNERYQSSVARVDKQLGDLLEILKKNGLLENSIVILLSDHGTTFGLPGDRLIDKQHYQGTEARLKWVTMNKLSRPSQSSFDLEQSYSLNTAYGQGTDVLSLKQYQVLLAFKYFEQTSFKPSQEKLGKQGEHSHWLPRRISHRSSLLDIAPTILALLQFPAMKNVDGVALDSYVLGLSQQKKQKLSRPLYLETGYSASELETNHIEVEKVVKGAIHLYAVDPKNGYLYIKPTAESAVLQNKQRAILMGPWLLARYPASSRNSLIRIKGALATKTYILPAYYVLANTQTGQWTVGLDTALAKKAPVRELQQRLKVFYGKELQ